MKTFIRGNQVLVQTDILEEDYKKYHGYEVFTVQDEEGNAVYRLVKTHTSNVTAFGIACNTTFQGKLAASTTVPEHVDLEDFVEFLKPALLALKENEATILEQIGDIMTRLEGIEDTITIEE